MAAKNSTRTTGKELTDFAILAIKKPGQHADRSINPLGALKRGLVLKVSQPQRKSGSTAPSKTARQSG